ncbi:MAG TPA: glycosyltransferase family 39 protein [Fimbriimonas sp.]|nr:glycosyltransferase family 39 protein [Fimbriimonas sp.]
MLRLIRDRLRKSPKMRNVLADVCLLAASCFLIGSTCGYATYRLTHDDDLRYFGYPWHAKWITSPYRDNESVCFRKTITVTRQPTAAYMVVAVNNFYDLTINGEHLKQFFRPSLFRTWERDQSLYTGIGYFRRDDLARFYDIKPYLVAGKNVIAFSVQSDEGRPKLGAEMAIFAGDETRYESDGSWRCSPVAQQRDLVPWNQGPNFFDGDWDHAIVQAERVMNVAVDGEKDVFEQPLDGFFISAPPTLQGASQVFEKHMDLGNAPAEAWFRLSSLNPYDLSINGRLVGSTAMINRYSRPIFTKRGNNDAMDRLVFTNQSGEYPKAEISRYVDVYLVKDLLKKGDNTIRVTVHTQELKHFQTYPQLYVDGNLTFRDGQERVLHSDLNWAVRSEASSAAAEPPRISSAGQILNAHRTKLRFRGKFDAGLHSQVVAAKIQIGFTAVAFACVLTASYCLARRRPDRLLVLAALIAAVPALVCVASFGVQWIFADSPQNEFLTSNRYWRLLIEANVVAFLSAILLAASDIAGRLAQLRSQRVEAGFWNRHGFKIGLGVIIAGSFVMCLTNYAANNYLADEYVSILAAQGILKHGYPVFDATNIVYTRSSLYHYLLALFMWVGRADGELAARLLSACWQAATILLCYKFAKEMRGRVAGLLTAALCAFSPFMLFYAREVRFYAQFEFFIALAFFLLWKSLHHPEDSKYRAGVLLAFCGAYLSQQFAAAIVPSIVIAVAVSGQLKLWFKWPTLGWLLFACVVVFADFVAYMKLCVTPLPYVDAESVSLLAFHTDVLEVLPSMLFSNTERTQFILGGFYAGGLILTLFGAFKTPEKKGWNWSAFLYLCTLPSIIVTTLLSSRPTSRYIVQFAPLALIVAVCIALDLIAKSSFWIHRRRQFPTLGRWIVAGSWGTLLLLLFGSFRPARTWNSFYRTSNRGLTSASVFVRNHVEPGDKIMFFSPEAAMVELGHCDYLFRPVLGSIYKYISLDGAMRERNSGALVVDNADKLSRIMAQNDRVWAVVNTRSISNPNDTYKGAMGQLLRDNFSIQYEPTGVEVLLWDRSKNYYHSAVGRSGYDIYNFQ